jgi:hypothetical protein
MNTRYKQTAKPCCKFSGERQGYDERTNENNLRTEMSIFGLQKKKLPTWDTASIASHQASHNKTLMNASSNVRNVRENFSLLEICH